MLLKHASVSLALALAAGSALAQVSFSGPTTIPTGQRPGGIVVVDIDLDGDNDVVFTTDTQDRLNVLRNTAGVLAAAPGILLPNGAGAGDTLAADFDGDGDMDIAVAYQNFNQVQIFTNTTGVLTAGANIATGTDPRNLIAADLNGDGRIDIAAVSRDDNAALLLTNGALGWTAGAFAVGNDPRGIAAGDFDGDGDADLIITNHDDRTMRVLVNGGAGTMTNGSLINVGAAFRADGVTTGDFNRDGRLDVATTLSDNGADWVGVMLGGAAGFGPIVRYASLGSNPGEIVAFDTDADGDLDLATVNQDSGTIVVLPNMGNGTFGTGTTFPASANADSIAVGNITGSATPELLVANRDANTIGMFTNLIVPPPAGCDSIDFNGNGLFPEDQDVIDFFSVLAGGACSTGTCNDVDFNNNGLFPEDADVADFFRVLGGGACN